MYRIIGIVLFNNKIEYYNKDKFKKLSGYLLKSIILRFLLAKLANLRLIMPLSVSFSIKCPILPKRIIFVI